MRCEESIRHDGEGSNLPNICFKCHETMAPNLPGESAAILTVLNVFAYTRISGQPFTSTSSPDAFRLRYVGTLEAL
jgi:hypothetical protein